MGAVSVRKAATCVRAIGGDRPGLRLLCLLAGTAAQQLSFAKQGSVG